MRQGDTVTYLFGDHLGSTSVAFNDAANATQSQGYTAFGSERYSLGGEMPTDYEYTGQKEFAEIGLQFYNARWYDGALGRFTQADTIIPQPGNPMAWDRFAYTLNNPVKYTDPTGHFTGYACKHMADGYCMDNAASGTNFYAVFHGNFTVEQKRAYTDQLKTIATRLADSMNETNKQFSVTVSHFEEISPLQAFLLMFGGPIEFTLYFNAQSWAAEVNWQGGINIYQPQWASNYSRLISHEIGHIVYNLLGHPPIPNELDRQNNDYGTDPVYNGFCGGKYICQFSLPEQLAYDWEIFADMFLGWSVNDWGEGDIGNSRKDYMERVIGAVMISCTQ